MSPNDVRTVTWHTLAPEEVAARLGVESAPEPGKGLSRAQAEERLARFGPNALPEGHRRSLAAMVLGQFADVMILVLVGAAVVSGLIGEPQDTIAILVILVLNALIGAVQEYRAERAVEALRRMAAPEARVWRDGELHTLPAQELVPGDRVVLEAGGIVPADLRLLEAVELHTDESALTGESHAVQKSSGPLEPAASTEDRGGIDVPLGDRRNMAFKSTHVTHGRGVGLVVASGLSTEIGRIAGLLAEEEGVKTPLQKRLARFGRYLALAVLAICAVVFVSGLLQGQPLMLMFLTSVSLAVAAIPEALPAVITVSLALGARKLGRRQALVRNLSAVETLGSVTFVCTDKTGTLTENRMTVQQVVVAGERHVVATGERHDAPLEASHLAPGASPVLDALARGLALNNDVEKQGDRAVGDPTEVALVVWAEQAGFRKSDLERAQPRLAEIPFDSDRKRMTTLHRLHPGGEELVAWVKGAPEAVLPLCSDALGEAGSTPLDAGAVLAEATALADQGHRVLAVAQRRLDSLPSALDEAEGALTLLGLVALMDPPRPEARDAVAECQSAGITPVMITGDHPGTARAIAERVGILASGGEGGAPAGVGLGEPVITGRELAGLSDAELNRRVEDIRVYARVSPEQKIRIVKALQEYGEFVAMTGDGVNDAPALKRAGIGVAMGENGVDVARQAADMVLLDDNFATIVGAVREGRRIFDNIRKFIKDTMSSNSGEIWTLFLAPFLGLPVPLLPIHILWVNLVTDGLPGLAFTAEPAEPGIMRRPPRPPQESIFAHGMWQHIVWVGLFVGAISIASQAWAYAGGAAYWQTVVFTVLTLSQLFHSLAVRSERASLLRIGLASNLPMLGAVLFTVGLQLAVIYAPPLNAVFKTQPLPAFDLAICFALSSLVLVAVEVEKALVRRGLLYA